MAIRGPHGSGLGAALVDSENPLQEHGSQQFWSVEGSESAASANAGQHVGIEKDEAPQGMAELPVGVFALRWLGAQLNRPPDGTMAVASAAGPAAEGGIFAAVGAGRGGRLLVLRHFLF